MEAVGRVLEVYDGEEERTKVERGERECVRVTMDDGIAMQTSTSARKRRVSGGRGELGEMREEVDEEKESKRFPHCLPTIREQERLCTREEREKKVQLRYVNKE
jgi:hypothetical protein